MAWLYLREFGPAAAARHFVDDLQRFAAAKGVPGLYHATITQAYLSMVAERIAATPDRGMGRVRRRPSRPAALEAGRARCLLLAGSPVE